MILKTNEFIRDLDGKNTDLTVGKGLANIALVIKSDPLRAYLLAQKLYQSPEVDLEVADYEFIKKAVEEHGREVFTNNLVVGQLSLILTDLKPKK